MAQLLPEKQIKVQSNLREKALPTTSFRSLGEVSSACLQSSPTLKPQSSRVTELLTFPYFLGGPPNRNLCT